MDFSKASARAGLHKIDRAQPEGSYHHLAPYWPQDNLQLVQQESCSCSKPHEKYFHEKVTAGISETVAGSQVNSIDSAITGTCSREQVVDYVVFFTRKEQRHQVCHSNISEIQFEPRLAGSIAENVLYGVEFSLVSLCSLRDYFFVISDARVHSTKA